MSGLTLKLLLGLKFILYAMVFIRVWQKTPLTVPLVLLAFAMIISGFWRNFYEYERPSVNTFTLHLDLLLAFLFSLLTNTGFDKFFIVYMVEGIAVLSYPYWIAYLIITMVISTVSTALLDLRTIGQIQPPIIAEQLLLVLIFILVFSERKQREQRLVFEKQTKELEYVNLQLKESIAWSESLASEAERQRIAGEIHDSLGHDLTGLILTLEAGKRVMNRDAQAAGTYWDKSLQVARSAIESVRELVSVMKEIDTEFELIARLREMAKGVQDLTGLKIELEFSSEDINFSRQEQFNIYRVFQEAFTNTLRHARAEHVKIVIRIDKQLLYFSYCDDGCGTDSIKEGNGLRGMVTRISDIGGRINFQSGGCGFQLEGFIERQGTD